MEKTGCIVTSNMSIAIEFTCDILLDTKRDWHRMLVSHWVINAQNMFLV